jgi:hypothetical protein
VVEEVYLAALASACFDVRFRARSGAPRGASLCVRLAGPVLESQCEERPWMPVRRGIPHSSTGDEIPQKIEARVIPAKSCQALKTEKSEDLLS